MRAWLAAEWTCETSGQARRAGASPRRSPGWQGGLHQWDEAGERWGLTGFRIAQVRRGAEKPEARMGPLFLRGSGVHSEKA